MAVAPSRTRLATKATQIKNTQKTRNNALALAPCRMRLTNTKQQIKHEQAVQENDLALLIVKKTLRRLAAFFGYAIRQAPRYQNISTQWFKQSEAKRSKAKRSKVEQNKAKQSKVK